MHPAKKKQLIEKYLERRKSRSLNKIINARGNTILEKRLTKSSSVIYKQIAWELYSTQRFFFYPFN